MTTYIYVKMYTAGFITALFRIAKKCKQSTRPSMDEWIHKMWYTRTTEYYSALKRKEILIHATTRMNLKNNISEVIQAQNDKYCVIPLI